MSRVVVWTATVCLAWALATASTAQASRWSVSQTPNPSGAVQAALTGVSCASPTACFAVGMTDRGVVERWNGTRWSGQPVAAPLGASQVDLLGVSCSSPSACIAVGSYRNQAHDELTLAEHWDGTSWSILPTPNPATGSPQSLIVLQAVSCTSPSACTAVGNDGAGTLVERWDGTSWSIQPSPNPVSSNSRYPEAELSGVSCSSPTACTAVGDYPVTAGQAATLVERWDGTSWSIDTTPTPAGATNSFLVSVSCTAPNACVAVGTFNDAGLTSGPLAERWDGSSWSIQTTPNPAGATQAAFESVSCTSPTSCTAVGGHDDASCCLRPVEDPTGQTLAEHWDGTAWSIQPTANPSGGSSTAAGVSCTSENACVAVGGFRPSGNPGGTDVALAERWSGAGWSIQPTLGPNGSLAGVSCASKLACVAVGSYTRADGSEATLAESSDGDRWSIQPTPHPSGAVAAFLSGVSCAPAGGCTAVGTFTNTAGQSQTLAERWNGTRWSIQRTPNPDGQGSLSGVSCASARFCIAVGGGLIEHWDGRRWSIQASVSHNSDPTNPSPGGDLTTVSCVSPTFCIAAGGSLIERWNGARWLIQRSPNPAGRPVLTSVSCSSRSACTAVGSYFSGTTAILVERWNGARWSIEPSLHPTVTPTIGNWTAVSCSSRTECTAVGFSRQPTTMLIRHRNGTAWPLQRPARPGLWDGTLMGVSCPSASNCAAVGSYGSSSGQQVTLVERER
jgi:hypothetical protein